jgi:hypothetical protein
MSLYSIYLYENRTLKCVKISLSRGRRRRENNGGAEPNQGTLQAYMEMSQ